MNEIPKILSFSLSELYEVNKITQNFENYNYVIIAYISFIVTDKKSPLIKFGLNWYEICTKITANVSCLCVLIGGDIWRKFGIRFVWKKYIHVQKWLISS
jgi:hypothetical protein